MILVHCLAAFVFVKNELFAVVMSQLKFPFSREEATDKKPAQKTISGQTLTGATHLQFSINSPLLSRSIERTFFLQYFKAIESLRKLS